MVKYTALCDFTILINNSSKKFLSGEVYESTSPVPELEAHIIYGFVSRDEVVEKEIKPTKKS